jgi:hypothetical protein
VTPDTAPTPTPDPFGGLPAGLGGGWAGPRQAGPAGHVGGNQIHSIADAQALLGPYGIHLQWGNDPNRGPTLMGIGKDGQAVSLWKSSWVAAFAARNGLPREFIDVLNRAQSIGHMATQNNLDPNTATMDSIHAAMTAAHPGGASSAAALAAAPRNQFGQGAVGFDAAGQPVYSWSQVVQGAGPAAAPAAPPAATAPPPAPGAVPPPLPPGPAPGTIGSTPPQPPAPGAPPDPFQVNKVPDGAPPVGTQVGPAPVQPPGPPTPAKVASPFPTPTSGMAAPAPAPPSASNVVTPPGKVASASTPSPGATVAQTTNPMGAALSGPKPLGTGITPYPLGTAASGTPSPFGAPLPPTGTATTRSPFQYSGRTRY